ncbi:MAG: right-handed parallel beta-helix repeat-containing protein [Clostridia bacterium]|nr:right-handed parallel beta-helix repeat-containing protein [Clostridia bacterium]
MKKFYKHTAWLMAVLLTAALIPACGGPSGGAKTPVEIRLTACGAKGDGVTDDRPALEQALQQANGKGVVLLPQGRYLLAGDVTVPAGVTLRFEAQAVLVVAAGATLTLQGKIEAAAARIFDGEGALAGHIEGAGYAEWFGAAGHNEDDSAAVQQAVDLLDTVYLTSFAGAHTLGGIRITRPVTVEGIGDLQAKLYMEARSEQMFTIASGGVTLRNLSVVGNGRPKGVVFYLDSAERDLSGIRLENLYGFQIANWIGDNAEAAHVITDLVIDTVRSDYNTGVGIRLNRCTSGLVIEDILINNVGVNTNQPLLIIENAEKVRMRNMDTAGGLGTGSGGHGFIMRNCRDVLAERCMVDHVNGYSMILQDCSNFRIINWISSLYETGAFLFENVTDSTFENIKANGIYGATTVRDPGPGMHLKGCSNLTFSSLMVEFNFVEGLMLEDCNNVQISNLVIDRNGGDGYVETGRSDGNVITGATITASGTCVRQIGAHSAIRALVARDVGFRESVEGKATL